MNVSGLGTGGMNSAGGVQPQTRVEGGCVLQCVGSSAGSRMNPLGICLGIHFVLSSPSVSMKVYCKKHNVLHCNNFEAHFRIEWAAPARLTLRASVPGPGLGASRTRCLGRAVDLALWEDFDVRLVDALSVCLQVSNLALNICVTPRSTALPRYGPGACTAFPWSVKDLANEFALIATFCIGQGDEALRDSVSFRGNAFSNSIRGATSFHGAVRNSLSLHADVALEPASPGFFSRRMNTQHRVESCFETPQFEAMGRWLLDVAQDLLDPELCWAAEPPGAARWADRDGRRAERKVSEPGGSSSWERWADLNGGWTESSRRRSQMTPKQRFEFLVQQV
jgi:hypothetical protein